MHRPDALTYGCLLGITLLIAIGIGGCPTGPGGPGGIFNLAPTAVITSDVERGVAPLTVQFNSDRSTDDGIIVTRLWEFGDNTTSQELSPRHTYTVNGDFTVKLTLTDDSGLKGSTTKVISVTEAPIAVIQYSPTSAESAPATISFDASASRDPDGEIVSYRWDFGDGTRETEVALTHVFNSAGTFRVRLTVTDDKGVTDTAERLIPIGIPRPTIELRTPPTGSGNIVLSPESPLWVQAVYTVDKSASFFTRAGLDLDRDLCDAKAVLYDMNNGAAIFEFTGHQGYVKDTAFSPDGALVATGSDDQSVRIYRTATGAFATSFDTNAGVNAVAFSPGGTRLALGLDDGDIVLATVASAGGVITITQERVLAGHAAGINDVAFSPDGNQLLSGSSDQSALLWNIADGTVLRNLLHDLDVNAVAFSPGRQDLVATGGSDGAIKIWNTTSGAELFTLTGHEAAVNDLAFSSDGLLLISAGNDNEIRIWNPFLGILVARYRGHGDDVTAVAIAPNGTRIVSGSADFSVRTWDTTTAAQRLNFKPCESPINAIDVSPDSTMFVAAIGAASGIQLDTDPPSGKDLAITTPQALRLNNVEALNYGDVPAGEYNLWVEIDTNKTELPERVYADMTVTVVDTFPTNLNTPPPVIRLTDPDEEFTANVIVDPTQQRQIFDLGPLDEGDRISVELIHTPGHGVYYTPVQEYSVMILDSARKIFAWHQALDRVGAGGAYLDLLKFVFFTRHTNLVIGHFSANYYVVADGGVSVRVHIQPAFQVPPPTAQQRVYVRFDGGVGIAAGNQPPRIIPALNAADFNSFTDPPKNWGAAETQVMRDAVITRLQTIYARYNLAPGDANTTSGIKFYRSDVHNPNQIPTPYQTIYVGGSTPDNYLGIADYVDPRNSTTTGTAIVFATNIAQRGMTGGFSGAMNSALAVGNAMGNVAAHVLGYMIGLRNTSDATDVMQGTNIYTIGDPTVFRTLKTNATVTVTEQVGSLAPIGIQDAIQLLDETIGVP